MTAPVVLVERPAEAVVLIRINRPEARNALNMEVRRLIAKHLTEAGEDDAVRAIASAPGGTSSVITEPAAIHASSPISTGATKALSTPVLTLRPIVVRCFVLVRCSRLTVMLPAAMLVSSPTSASPR